jgi:hypothetical protein
MVRALYLLNFAYTDEHNKEYYKKLAKMINSASKKIVGHNISYVHKSLMEISKKTDIASEMKQWPNSSREFKDLIEKYFKDRSVGILYHLLAPFL